MKRRRVPAPPAGLRPPPRRVPAALRTDADLRALQRWMLHALVRPLTPSDGLQPRWLDGRPMAEVAAEVIRPGGRISPFERLQIYSRSYWFRLIDCVHEDAPGLRALLGERRFDALVRAYLAAQPSRSFTLRNLCARLPAFLRAHPRWAGRHAAFAAAVADFEWAQTVAFDGEARPVLGAADIAGAAPTRLRLRLQPYVTLLTAAWPVDDYVLAVKQRDALRSAASHAVDGVASRAAARRVARPRRQRVYVAVHRLDNRLYYKRLEPAACRILSALAAGRTLAAAVAAGGPRVRPAQVQAWFAAWMGFGWFCARGKN